MTKRLLALSILLASAAPAATGDLLVAPTRVVLDGQRGTEVILNNVGDAPATYRISLELRRMTRDGRLEDIAADAVDAHGQATLGMISYAPRRIVLAPNMPQAIRIGVRPPEGLPDGEYRAHLLFRAIPDTAPVTAATPAKGVAIALTPIYGVSIPVIVRQGSLTATAALSNPRRCGQDAQGHETAPGAAGSAPSLCLTLARSGGRSTYGRIRVTRAGLDKPLVDARGIAVYAEISERTVALPVPPEVAAQLSGPIKVEYLEDTDAGGGTIAQLQAVIR